MCTLTVKWGDDHLLVTMNRDEKKDRAPEVPPHKWNSPDIIAPQDSKGLGTWAAINQSGQIACLLNGYQEQDFKKSGLKSRGEIIPAILASENPYVAAENIEASQYASFDLFVIDGTDLKHYCWNGKDYSQRNIDPQEWFFFTSSSWNSKEVKQTRRNAYEDWYKQGALIENNLPNIHIYQSAGSSAYSVLMEREDACTKSITQFECHKGGNVLRYWPEPHKNKQNFEQFSVI